MTNKGAFETGNSDGYAPLLLCVDCEVSFHDDRDGISASLYGNRRAAVKHAGHALEYATEAEVLAIGWTPDRMTAWPYGPVRRAA